MGATRKTMPFRQVILINIEKYEKSDSSEEILGKQVFFSCEKCCLGGGAKWKKNMAKIGISTRSHS